MEKWVPVVKYVGIYEVSAAGKVRSVDRIVLRGSVKQPLKGKVLSPSRNPQNGYLTVGLFKNGKPKYFHVHRLVAQAFVPNPDNLPEVNHEDLDKENNAASNLKWTTHSGNKVHAIANGVVFGRPLRGEEAGNAKLTWKKVRKIRTKYASGKFSQKQLAEMFQVTQPAVSGIVRGVTWKE